MTASQPIYSQFSRSLQVPPLENGDRLTRIEFERRYNAMPSLYPAIGSSISQGLSECRDGKRRE